MIESISISGEDVRYIFEAQQLAGLSAINFIYGANGSGKTTISKIILIT
ncbi:AAA family ATPase [Methyloglobulus sp.]